MDNGKCESTRERVSAGGNPKTLLIPCVLLLLRNVNAHGYQIIQDLVKFGFSALDHGHVYRILRQLENDRLVESRWEVSSGGPPRRMYSLTEAGTEYLDMWSEALERYQYTLDRFFSMYERLLFPSEKHQAKEGKTL
ncbi:PadR family transcriptional regulator [Aneurinibacillus soli]|uniref:Lineage-specific thermal regulator protein n=1 Tax=Aneurinibacillus soli TaxID=1500254 RepID=A0A0U5AU95_9BACL|nr:poly-beta-hydroxybutyrate-responsive repressor [Aneurinibacillus soli]PYE63734.1 PadR family transcriptional regulator [Aneurinibacillus soli]BAU27333.1 lineage-specific thermal regulator protein [Aneurinibacillus soli]